MPAFVRRTCVQHATLFNILPFSPLLNFAPRLSLFPYFPPLSSFVPLQQQQQGVGAAVGGAAAAVGGAAAAAAGTAGAATATAGMGGAQTPATGAATAGAAAAAGGGAAAGAAGAAAGAGAGAGTVNGIPIQQPEAVQKVAPSSVQQPPDGVNQGAAQDQGSVTKEHVQVIVLPLHITPPTHQCNLCIINGCRA